MSIQIEKGVPMPTSRVNKKYPFAEMEIGDSFVADAKAQAVIGVLNKNNAPKKWVSRTIEDGRVRVWRVA